VNPEIPRNDDDDDDDAADVKEIHCPLPRLLVQENRSVHFLTIFRTVSFMLPMAFWILQRCAPPCRQTVTWHRRPTCRQTEPLASFAVPAIRSLPMTNFSCCSRPFRLAAGTSWAGQSRRTASRAIPECRSKSCGVLPAPTTAIIVIAM